MFHQEISATGSSVASFLYCIVTRSHWGSWLVNRKARCCTLVALGQFLAWCCALGNSRYSPKGLKLVVWVSSIKDSLWFKARYDKMLW